MFKKNKTTKQEKFTFPTAKTANSLSSSITSEDLFGEYWSKIKYDIARRITLKAKQGEYNAAVLELNNIELVDERRICYIIEKLSEMGYIVTRRDFITSNTTIIYADWSKIND